jgi:hypothetical protein
MEPLTFLLGGTVLFIALFFLLNSDKRKKEVARRVNKLRGPMCCPIVGTYLPMLLVKQRGE